METDGAPGGVVVSAEQIEKLMAERNAAVRAEVDKTPPPAPETPPEPRDATRAEKEEIVYLNLSELFPFKDHPFGVRDDAEMKGLVLISCGARLAPFDIPQLREIMGYDEMELDRLGDKRTAAFFIISDTDTTYNFIVALAFSQMFKLLCERADNISTYPISRSTSWGRTRFPGIPSICPPWATDPTCSPARPIIRRSVLFDNGRGFALAKIPRPLIPL